jgi:site-specific DNA-cytosine methylase
VERSAQAVQHGHDEGSPGAGDGLDQGDPYVVVDICIRMLTPRELANASTFPPQYILSHGHDGRVFTKSQQVFFIGNCVPPELQYHVTAAIYSDEPQQMLEAA